MVAELKGLTEVQWKEFLPGKNNEEVLEEVNPRSAKIGLRLNVDGDGSGNRWAMAVYILDAVLLNSL